MRKFPFLQEYVKYPLLIMSIAFIVIGLMNEENQAVLKKDIYICLECIGIG